MTLYLPCQIYIYMNRYIWIYAYTSTVLYNMKSFFTCQIWSNSQACEQDIISHFTVTGAKEKRLVWCKKKKKFLSVFLPVLTTSQLTM